MGGLEGSNLVHLNFRFESHMLAERLREMLCGVEPMASRGDMADIIAITSTESLARPQRRYGQQIIGTVSWSRPEAILHTSVGLLGGVEALQVSTGATELIYSLLSPNCDDATIGAFLEIKSNSRHEEPCQMLGETVVSHSQAARRLFCA